jgi:2-polyprenyl-6-methoxyphenol hydroxylase-like FAD-dependent oxidoreductase
MLDIHDYNGQIALDKAGLLPGFRALILEGRQQMRILERDGTVLLDMPDDGTRGRPEVMRGELRQLLLDSLPEGTVQWGRKVADVRAVADGHEVVFADGSSVTAKLLVGADGAWSKVRPLLSDELPEYMGLAFVETYLHDVDTAHPAAAKAAGYGSMGAPAPGRRIMTHRERGDIVHTYVLLTRPEEWFDAIDFSDRDAALARIAAEFDGYAPELLELITGSDTDPILRKHHLLPGEHRWDRTPGVTLVGDAAHLRGPNGEGANLAMLDGAELAEALLAHPDDVETALVQYEEKMFARAAEIAAIGDKVAKELAEEDGDDTAKRTAEKFKQLLERQ